MKNPVIIEKEMSASIDEPARFYLVLLHMVFWPSKEKIEVSMAEYDAAEVGKEYTPLARLAQ